MENMRFIGRNTPKGIHIPSALLKLSEFTEKEPVDIHALKDAVVVLKQSMTAKELVWAIHSLQYLVDDLTAYLFEACGECEECGEGCPMDDLDGGEIDLPAFLRDAAHIPEDAKLCASVNEDAGTILISQADYADDLRDLPEDLVRDLAECGLCMCELEKILLQGEIIYGS